MEEQCSSSNISTVEANTTTSPNDESLHISTSSSWTILQTDRAEGLGCGSSVSSLKLNAMNDSDKKNKIEEAERKQEHGSMDNYEHTRLFDNLDNQAEDVSDGISIISDCDSTGRLSPHSFLQEPNLNLGSGNELPTIHNLYENDQQIRGRRCLFLKQDDPTQVQETFPTRPISVGYRLLSFAQNGLTAVFYVGATLAILGFIGRLHNPEWKVLGDKKPLADIEQRLVDLEMQNNLMRAEIDLMSKQLLYLNTIANSRDQAHMQSKRPKTKSFMAWPGNGNSMDPLDVTKKDLKRPYKCSDGKYVEIAAMCVEIKPDVKSMEEDSCNMVNKVVNSRENSHVPFSKADAFKKHHKMKHVYKQDRYISNENESKERYSTNQDKSKKRYGKQHTIKRHGQDDRSSSGDWHEQMMQHREHSRQRREHSQNNNWYIERGGSREQKRSTEFRR